jgi:hypothetical protein
MPEAVAFDQGLGDATWGMTPDQVRAVYPEVTAVEGEDLVTRHPFAGFDAETNFHFDAGVLSDIKVTFQEPYRSLDDRLLGYMQLREQLVAVLGQPSATDPVPMARYQDTQQAFFSYQWTRGQFSLQHVLTGTPDTVSMHTLMAGRVRQE